jgi:hypothetical protein
VAGSCRGGWRRRAQRPPCGRDGRGTADGTRYLALWCRRPDSRDMRGMEVRFKITREASGPINPAIVGRGPWRSVKPSAQPTLVRTQRPPPEFPIYICEFGVAGLSVGQQDITRFPSDLDAASTHADVRERKDCARQ